MTARPPASSAAAPHPAELVCPWVTGKGEETGTDVVALLRRQRNDRRVVPYSRSVRHGRQVALHSAPGTVNCFTIHTRYEKRNGGPNLCAKRNQTAQVCMNPTIADAQHTPSGVPLRGTTLDYSTYCAHRRCSQAGRHHIHQTSKSGGGSLRHSTPCMQPPAGRRRRPVYPGRGGGGTPAPAPPGRRRYQSTRVCSWIWIRKVCQRTYKRVNVWDGFSSLIHDDKKLHRGRWLSLHTSQNPRGSNCTQSGDRLCAPTPARRRAPPPPACGCTVHRSHTSKRSTSMVKCAPPQMPTQGLMVVLRSMCFPSRQAGTGCQP